MKEINRRSMCTEESGMACGPISVTAIDAEIVVEDEGHTVYLHMQWVDAVSDMFLFEATTSSMYDEYEKIVQSEDEDLDQLFKERDEIANNTIGKIIPGVVIEERYDEQYKQLLVMVREEMVKNDIDNEYIENIFEKIGV